jgi:2,4-dienoyl-CoA reductase-like NADH-dependent reductase (Old Yellow Enzyme family)
MAPMTREAAVDGMATPAMVDYYRRRADGGVGLIISEGMAPDPVGLFGQDVPRLYGSEAVESWRSVLDAVHAGGAAMFAQIWHVGAFDPSLIGMRDSISQAGRLSPSGLAGPGVKLGRAMSLQDVGTTIDAFAAAARAAQSVGFDGVEIHGAHGYLPDQFLWCATNTRTDAYGRSLVDRSRFASELVAECRRRVGREFPICFRFSQWKQLDYAARLATSPKELEQLLTPLVEAGVDMLHVSTRRFWEPAFSDSERSLAAWTREATGLPVIAVGSVTLNNDFKSQQGKVQAETDPGQIALLLESMERGDFDLIALGRMLLANPDWVQLVTTGRGDALVPFSRSVLDDLW